LKKLELLDFFSKILYINQLLLKINKSGGIMAIKISQKMKKRLIEALGRETIPSNGILELEKSFFISQKDLKEKNLFLLGKINHNGTDYNLYQKIGW
jgi:hypothetical protein